MQCGYPGCIAVCYNSEALSHHCEEHKGYEFMDTDEMWKQNILQCSERYRNLTNKLEAFHGTPQECAKIERELAEFNRRLLLLEKRLTNVNS